jgi:hypothetical protein
MYNKITITRAVNFDLEYRKERAQENPIEIVSNKFCKLSWNKSIEFAKLDESFLKHSHKVFESQKRSNIHKYTKTKAFLNIFFYIEQKLEYF